jgi:hypothetical protein
MDVFDLRVRAEAIVVPAKVRLSVRQKDRLVLASSERRQGEVPPLSEEERGEEDDYREA